MSWFDLDALRVIAALFYTVLLHLRPHHHSVNTGVVSLFMPVLGLFDYVVAAEGCGWLLILSFNFFASLCVTFCQIYTILRICFTFASTAFNLAIKRNHAAAPSSPSDRCVCEWVSPLLRHSTFGGGLRWLLRASQTYAMQLCSIMSDQHLHNLYPSYSLRTNHALGFFPSRRGPWIIYILYVKYIYSVGLSGYWASSVIYHLWWRELGRAADWTNECKCSARLAWVSSHIPLSRCVFSPLSVQS